ncbi:hypothetical protein QOZ80_3AG0251000 [Eleusine coracana subsp. coracana]|nr:hypothetical protein QOZ80_3AG0251000 [Eleusine coracana subsp. coracana]
MFDDQDLGFFVNFLGVFIFVLVTAYHFVMADQNESIFGFSDAEEEAPELGMDLNLSSFADLSLESNELVGSLLEQEKEQLAGIEAGDYLERLNDGGIEFSWRNAAIEWFGEVQAHYNFGPLCVYLAVNYLDRFLSSNVPDDKEWAKQALSVACLSIAAKMEETAVPPYVHLIQVSNVKHILDAETIERMEVFVLRALNWRMKAVTPFSYISYFAEKFNEGKPVTDECISRCTELILGTLKATKFLQFKPSEIAAAVVLYTVAETKVFDFNSALLTSEIPVDKEKVRRCHEAIKEVALVETNSNISVSSSSVPESPSNVLNASCFSFGTDDSQIPGSSKATNDNNATSYQSCTPVSKRTRLD